MKDALIAMISNQEKRMNGNFIEQPVEAYVEKILLYANMLTYIIQGRIAGFVAYYCNDHLSQQAFLTMLCIDPEHSGKGIGSHLLNCSIADIENKGFMEYQLEVNENNHQAIRLYKRAGFEITGIRVKTLTMKKVISHEG